MAKPGARTAYSDLSPLELKLQRIVRRLARAEARGWLNGQAANLPSSTESVASAGDAAALATSAADTGRESTPALSGTRSAPDSCREETG